MGHKTANPIWPMSDMFAVSEETFLKRDKQENINFVAEAFADRRRKGTLGKQRCIVHERVSRQRIDEVSLYLGNSENL